MFHRLDSDIHKINNDANISILKLENQSLMISCILKSRAVIKKYICEMELFHNIAYYSVCGSFQCLRRLRG